MSAYSLFFPLPPELVFELATVSVVPAWVLLAAAPRARATRYLAHSIAPVLILGVLYGGLIAGGAFGGPGASLSSLDGVMRLAQRPEAVLAAWVHYLVLDLFAGAWMVRDARDRGIAHLAVLPSLAVTALLGPLGLGLYFLTRVALARGGWALDPVR